MPDDQTQIKQSFKAAPVDSMSSPASPAASVPPSTGSKISVPTNPPKENNPAGSDPANPLAPLPPQDDSDPKEAEKKPESPEPQPVKTDIQAQMHAKASQPKVKEPVAQPKKTSTAPKNLPTGKLSESFLKNFKEINATGNQDMPPQPSSRPPMGPPPNSPSPNLPSSPKPPAPPQKPTTPPQPIMGPPPAVKSAQLSDPKPARPEMGENAFFAKVEPKEADKPAPASFPSTPPAPNQPSPPKISSGLDNIRPPQNLNHQAPEDTEGLSPKKILVIILAAVILGAGAFGGYYYYQNYFAKTTLDTEDSANPDLGTTLPDTGEISTPLPQTTGAGVQNKLPINTVAVEASTLEDLPAKIKEQQLKLVEPAQFVLLMGGQELSLGQLKEGLNLTIPTQIAANSKPFSFLMSKENGLVKVALIFEHNSGPDVVKGQFQNWEATMLKDLLPLFFEQNTAPFPATPVFQNSSLFPNARFSLLEENQEFSLNYVVLADKSIITTSGSLMETLLPLLNN